MNTKYQDLRKDAPSELLNYFQLLWFRKRLILSITVIIGLLGVIWLSVQSPVYRSTSSLMIGFPVVEATGSGTNVPQNAGDRISNEIEMIRSRELISEVIKRFQLQVYGEFDPAQVVKYRGIPGIVAWLTDWTSSLWSDDDTSGQEAYDLTRMSESKLAVATDIFLDKLTLQRAGDSNVVNVSFASYDPRLATRIANALPEAYIAAQLQAKIAGAETESEQFSEQFRILKNQLTASQRAEEYYRKTLGVVELEMVEAFDQQLSDLNSQIIIARSEKAGALERLNLIESTAAEDASVEGVANRLQTYPLIQQLLEQKANLARTATDLAATGNTGHQKLLKVEAEIAQNNSAIRSEFSRITLELQSEVAQASQSVDKLETALTAIALESSTEQSRLLNLRTLREETAINQMKLEAFINRFKGTSFAATTFIPDSKIISLAAMSHKGLYPGRSEKTLIIVLSGLAIGVIWIFLLQLKNPGLLSPEHVEQVLGKKTIGVIPIIAGNQDAHEFAVENPDSDYASAIKALKITLDLSDMEKKVKVIQLVSSIPGEGKTSLAISLAQAVAGFGQKVLLVNADLRSSAIQEKLGLPLNTDGFTDLMLSSDSRLTDFVLTDVSGDIHYLPAGTATYANADVVFASQRMDTIVEMMRSQYDFIIFDAPPVQVNTDAVPLSRHIDKSLFVIRWNKTPLNKARMALLQLQAGNVDLAGVVLEQVNMQRYGNIAYSDYGYIYNQRF